MLAHIFSPRAQEAEAITSLEIQGKPGLCTKTQFKNNNINNQTHKQKPKTKI